MTSTDRWAAWLLEHRFGGDAALRDRILPRLYELRDRVLAGAGILAGDTVLDVGCGDGLLGLGALPLVGADGTVVFSDISTDLLDECRSVTAALRLPVELYTVVDAGGFKVYVPPG